MFIVYESVILYSVDFGPFLYYNNSDHHSICLFNVHNQLIVKTIFQFQLLVIIVLSYSIYLSIDIGYYINN